MTDGAAAAAQGSAEPPLHRPPPWTCSGTCRSPSARRARLPVSGAGKRAAPGCAASAIFAPLPPQPRPVPPGAAATARSGSRPLVAHARSPAPRGRDTLGLIWPQQDSQPGALVPGLTACWEPRELREQVSTPVPSVRDLHGPCRAVWPTSSGGVCSPRLGNVFGRE